MEFGSTNELWKWVTLCHLKGTVTASGIEPIRKIHHYSRNSQNPLPSFSTKG